jgi:hypothetical protein
MASWLRNKIREPHVQQAFSGEQDLVCMTYFWTRTDKNIVSAQATSHVEQQVKHKKAPPPLKILLSLEELYIAVPSDSLNLLSWR